MKTLYKTLGLMAVVAVAGSVAPADVWADATTGAGSETLATVQNLFTGNIGLIVGLLIAAYGLWKWLISQETWGLILVIGGVLITLFPNIFGGLQKGIQPIIQDIGAAPANVNRD